MTPARIAALARRRVITPQVLNHVLGLVHDGYMPSGSVRLTSSSPLLRGYRDSSVRFASSAHAVQEPEDDTDHSPSHRAHLDLPPHLARPPDPPPSWAGAEASADPSPSGDPPSPPLARDLPPHMRPPPPSGESSLLQHRSSPPSLALDSLSSPPPTPQTIRHLPSPDAPLSLSGKPRTSRSLTRLILQHRLPTAQQFIELHEAWQLDDQIFRSTNRLAAIFGLFALTAQRDQWAWLLQQLRAPESDEVNAVNAFRKTLRACAELEMVVRDIRRDQLRDELLAIADQYPLPSKDTTQVQPHAMDFAARGLALAKCGADADAMAAMACCLQQCWANGGDVPLAVVDIVEAYANVTRKSLAELAIRADDKLVRGLISPESTDPLRSLIMDRLVQRPDPLAEARFLANLPIPAARQAPLLYFLAFWQHRRLDAAAGIFTDVLDINVGKPPLYDDFLHAILSGDRPEAGRVWQIYSTRYDYITKRIFAAARGWFQRSGSVADMKQFLARYGHLYDRKTDYRLALAKIYARFGRVQETSDTLQAAFGDYSTNLRAMKTLALAHVAANDPEGAENVIAKLPDAVGRGILLNMYADRGEVAKALATFETILDNEKADREHDYRPHYTTLISLFAMRQDIPNAERFFQAMQDKGYVPDGISWAALLNAYVEANDWHGAASRWEAIPEALAFDSAVCSTILKAFVLISAPMRTILRLFGHIVNPTTWHRNYVVLAACDKDYIDYARQLIDDYAPNVYTYSILMSARLRRDEGSEARLVYEEMLERKIIPISATYSSIINSFAAIRGDEPLQQAHRFAMQIQQMADESQLPEVGAARSLISGHLFGPLASAAAKRYDVEGVQQYVDFALSQGGGTFTADIQLWTTLMDAERRVGHVDAVMVSFERIFERALAMSEHRTNNNTLCIPLSIALDALSVAGRGDDVKGLWKRVKDAGFGFDSGNYNQMAVSLARTGDIEGAFHVVDRVLVPRQEEVEARHMSAMREAEWASLAGADAHEGERMVDRPAKTSKTRSRIGNKSEEQYIPPAGPTKGLGLEMLRLWRPTDNEWRPFTFTLAILSEALLQLQYPNDGWAMAGAVLQSSDDDDASLADADNPVQPMAFPRFNGVLLQNAPGTEDGRTRRQTPFVLLAKLRAKYVKTWSMVMIWRAKHRGRTRRERKEAVVGGGKYLRSWRTGKRRRPDKAKAGPGKEFFDEGRVGDAGGGGGESLRTAFGLSA